MVLRMPSKEARDWQKAAKLIQKLLRWRFLRQRGVPYCVEVGGPVDFEFEGLRVTGIEPGGQADREGMTVGSLIVCVGKKSCFTDSGCSLLMKATPTPFTLHLLMLQVLPPTHTPHAHACTHTPLPTHSPPHTHSPHHTLTSPRNSHRPHCVCCRYSQRLSYVHLTQPHRHHHHRRRHHNHTLTHTFSSTHSLPHPPPRFTRSLPYVAPTDPTA
jgi:hypothetical protein